MGCCSTFPCCLELPLDMGVQFVSMFDIITSFLFMLTYCTVHAVDLFAAQKENQDEIAKKSSEIEEQKDDGKVEFQPPSLLDREFPLYEAQVSSTSTTKRPWTLRSTTTPKPFLGEGADTVTISKTYAKISNITFKQHDQIQKKCGDENDPDEYIYKFLFGHELEKTTNLWAEFLILHIVAEAVYIALAVLTLLISCCFVEHRGAKILVMIAWWFEWIGIYLEVVATVLSQSKRLCILEYGFKDFHGQSVMMGLSLGRVIFFKFYQLLLLAVYISQLLHHGYLKNETLDMQTETAPVKNFYKHLYELEEKKGKDPVALASRDTSYAIGYQDIHPSNVDKIQNIMEKDPAKIGGKKKPEAE